jgi:acyl-[acyl-carrier-protein]-phospholipid O-acyltransferase/long-chain-fatty-acid--[acyl-carrier-protein] ligase
LDEDGFLTITDRLSRFSKIGGEMVPHLKVEEAIMAALGPEATADELLFAVTGVPDERKGEKLVVLHTRGLPVPVDEIWQRLKTAGLPPIWVPGRDAFHEVDEIPVLGTGKVDLRGLKALAVRAVKRSAP